LHYIVVLELVNSLVSPVSSDEMNVSVDNSYILPVNRQFLDEKVKNFLLVPDLSASSKLEVPGIILLRDAELSMSESNLGCIENSSALFYVELEVLVELPTRAIPNRIKYDSNNI
jgi:hypothetical protein